MEPEVSLPCTQKLTTDILDQRNTVRVLTLFI